MSESHDVNVEIRGIAPGEFRAMVEDIRRQRERGRSVTRIAAYYGLTREAVRGILAAPSPESYLSPRAAAVLDRHGLTLEEVGLLPDTQLLGFRGLGPKLLEELRALAPALHEEAAEEASPELEVLDHEAGVV